MAFTGMISEIERTMPSWIRRLLSRVKFPDHPFASFSEEEFDACMGLIAAHI